MPRSTCPDPALLQAYVDGTVFSRDVPAVEQHLASCERCAAIVELRRLMAS
jgi:anti-sigma factor RsiW